jgi:hypothetical protein
LVKLLLSGREDRAVDLFERNFDELKDQEFVIPTSQRGEKSPKCRLENLYQCLNFGPLFKSAFLKGLFPGKEPAYEVLSLLDSYQQMDFIELLPKLKNPELTCQIFLKNFKNKINAQEILNTVQAIEQIGNNQELIEQTEALLKKLKYESIHKVLTSVERISHSQRQEIIEQTYAITSEPGMNGYQKFLRSNNIDKIIDKVHELAHVSAQKKQLIWSITKKLETQWDKRLHLLEGLQTEGESRLTEIFLALDSPTDVGDADKIKERVNRKALRNIFEDTAGLFENRKQTVSEISKILEDNDSIPYSMYKQVASDLSLLFKGNDAAMPSASKHLEDIIIECGRLNWGKKQEKRRLVLDATREIMKTRSDWGFGLAVMERLSSFDRSTLKILRVGPTTSKKFLDLLAYINWKDDPYSKDGRHPIEVHFNYEEVLKHARTAPHLYDMEFLQSKEGQGLAEVLIKQLNQGRVPSKICDYFQFAYNRTDSKARYNKSLIANCISKFADLSQSDEEF